MPMHIPSSINTDSSGIATLFSKAGPIASPLSLATQNDILAILQREQDHAVSLLSLSPLLSSLFISYADRAVTLQSVSVTPSPESKEWRALQSDIAALREENEKLKSENRELAVKLATAEASQEAFRSQVTSLKEVNATQQGDIKSLQVELVKAKDTYDQLLMDSDAERATHQIHISDLETQRAELKEAVVEQQIKISKLERQASSGSSNLPKAATTIEPVDVRELDNREGLNREAVAARSAKAKEHADREATEQAEREARERAEEMVRVKAERDAKRKAEKEAKEQTEREAREKAERQMRERAERRKERLERIKKIEKEEEADREAKGKGDCEAKEREEEMKKVPVSKIPSAWGSNVGNSDRSRKTSGLSQKEQKNEWANSWDLGSTEKSDEPSGLPPIITSSIPGSILGSAGNFGIFATEKKDSPGGAEEVELRTPLTKRGKKGIDSLSNLSKVATPTETADFGKLDNLEDLGLNNISARVSISSENERFTDAEQGPSPTEHTHPALAPEVAPEALSSTTSELLKTPKDVRDEVPTTPRSWPAPLTATHQPQIPTPALAPAKTEPEKPLSLWERKKLNTATPPASASGLFGGGGAMNSSGVWGDASGGGNAGSIAMPTLVGDRQSIFADTARDRKRENQRENVVEGFLGSNPARRRNDSAQSGMTTKPAPKPAPAPAPVQQKSSGWGSWGSSLLTNIASAAPAPDRSPSPEPPPVKPKIEDPPRGFTPNQPPKSQPAGFGPLNKPGWGTGGGTRDNNVWGAGKPGPAPITQKTSTGLSWGAKPTGSTFGSGGTAWGSGTGSTFGSGAGKNLTVDTATKPLERSPSTAGPENIPESAVKIKHVPAPGGLNSSIADNDGGWGAQDDTWGLSEAGKDEGSKNSKVPSPIEKAPETQTEEAATPAEEGFDWANQGKKKGPVSSVTQTPSAPNTPDPENVDDGPDGGGAGGKGKRKKKGRK